MVTITSSPGSISVTIVTFQDPQPAGMSQPAGILAGFADAAACRHVSPEMSLPPIALLSPGDIANLGADGQQFEFQSFENLEG